MSKRKPMKDMYLNAYCDGFNDVYNSIRNLNVKELRYIIVNRASKKYSELSFAKKMKVAAANLAIRIKQNNSRSRDGRFRHAPINSQRYRSDSLIFNRGKWEIEHSMDKVLRLSYGRSPDLEHFIKIKGTFRHRELNNLMIDKFVDKYNFKKTSVETQGYEAADRDDLRVGPRYDGILHYANNRRVLIETMSRSQLNRKYVEQRSNEVLINESDKLIFVALSWTKDAESLVKMCPKLRLFTVNKDFEFIEIE